MRLVGHSRDPAALASRVLWSKFANLVKTGCVSRKPKTQLQKSGIRKSKTSRWRGAALILLNLFMIAHIIQWRVMGKTVSPIEPSETMYTLQKGFINAGFIFFSLAILATLVFGDTSAAGAVTSSRCRISADGC
jgi:hypothetical protein